MREAAFQRLKSDDSDILQINEPHLTSPRRKTIAAMRPRQREAVENFVLGHGKPLHNFRHTLSIDWQPFVAAKPTREIHQYRGRVPDWLSVDHQHRYEATRVQLKKLGWSAVQSRPLSRNLELLILEPKK